MLNIIGFKVKFEHLYKQTGLLKIVVSALVKNSRLWWGEKGSKIEKDRSKQIQWTDFLQKYKDSSVKTE